MIHFEAALHVELHYHLLSHLDLGRDAASIYRPRHPTPAWTSSARAGYDGLPAQVRALRASDLDALCESSPAPWADALRAAAARHPWPPPPPTTEAIAPALARIHTTLWALADSAPPPLRVFDTPALGTHGRATMLEGVQIVAVSLADPEHALCQIAHEACHAVTDSAVRARIGGVPDTRPGHPGFALHHALEAVAIEVVRDVTAEVEPAWSATYARWCSTFEA